MFVNVVLRSAMEIKDFYTWEANDKKQSKFPSFPFSFYANQIITPSLSSMDSANRDRVEGFQPIVIGGRISAYREILTPLIVSLL